LSRGRVFIGTSGYSYKHWKGVFYPKGLNARKWLEHYTGSFDTVELNVTFYRMPAPNVFSDWRDHVPEGFCFSVKGNRFITHIKRLKSARGPLDLFFSRARLLKNKLGPILWQLPPTFKRDVDRLASFVRLLRKYKSVRHVFEFRNKTWLCGEVSDILKKEKISVCSADWPEFNKKISGTADFVYLRRHGQGAKLYNGCYSKGQIKIDASLIKKHLAKGRDVYIYFNNDAHGYAVENALELKDMLTSSGKHLSRI